MTQHHIKKDIQYFQPLSEHNEVSRWLHKFGKYQNIISHIESITNQIRSLAKPSILSSASFNDVSVTEQHIYLFDISNDLMAKLWHHMDGGFRTKDQHLTSVYWHLAPSCIRDWYLEFLRWLFMAFLSPFTLIQPHHLLHQSPLWIAQTWSHISQLGIRSDIRFVINHHSTNTCSNNLFSILDIRASYDNDTDDIEAKGSSKRMETSYHWNLLITNLVPQEFIL